VQDLAEANIRRIAAGIASALNVAADVRYERRYPPTINNADAAAFTVEVARDVFGERNLELDRDPKMAAEDFSFMLNVKPGAYVWLGNGPGEGGCLLHNPRYDFNDAALPLGASYWARLVETKLSPPA
jgi:hippurate hydrolase